MMAMTDCAWPVNGRAFEDILDGYFPLGESVRQMMERHGFATMWIALLHAPVMNIRGLPPTAPVPLSLPKTYSGMIDNMSLLAVQCDEGVRLAGVGDWLWVDGRAESETFPVSTRLGEPAFVRGIGIAADTSDASGEGSAATVALARLDNRQAMDNALAAVTRSLGWRASRVWGLGTAVSEIRRTPSVDTAHALFGRRFDAAEGKPDPSHCAPVSSSGWDYLLVDVSPDQADGEALELALRL